MTVSVQSLDRLIEIKQEIKELMQEARQIARRADKGASSRFESYAYAHIVSALDKDHDYLGGSMVTMQDVIEELEDGAINAEMDEAEQTGRQA
jgi:hypothetical protein